MTRPLQLPAVLGALTTGALLLAAATAAQVYVPGLDHGVMGGETGGEYWYGSWHEVDCPAADCSYPNTLVGGASFLGESLGQCYDVGSPGVDLYCSVGPTTSDQCDELGEDASGWFILITTAHGGEIEKQTASMEYCESISGEGGGDGGAN